MLQSKGSVRLLCVAFVLMMICCTVSLAAPGVPDLYDLDGARFGIKTTGTRYSIVGGREYKYKGEWEWEISVESPSYNYGGLVQDQAVSTSGGPVIVHERGTDGEHDFAATYGNGILVWGQASSDEPQTGSSSAIYGMAFIRGKAGKLKIKGIKDIYVIPPADDYATRMAFKGKQLTEKDR